MTELQPLKLIARSSEDITVMSALLQDALLASADMQFIPDDNSFVVLANRFLLGRSGCKSAAAASLRAENRSG